MSFRRHTVFTVSNQEYGEPQQQSEPKLERSENGHHKFNGSNGSLGSLQPEPRRKTIHSTASDASKKRKFEVSRSPSVHFEEDEEKPSILMFIAAFSALLAAVSQGLIVNYSSPALSDLELDSSVPRLDPSETETRSWVGSSTALAALVGGFLASPLTGNLGRKWSLVFIGIPLTAAWLLIFFAKTIGMIIAGRALSGIAMGMISGTCPIYLVEISTTPIRGQLGCCFQLFITIGILISAILGKYVHWDVLAIISAIPGVIMTILMIFMPETPSYLMRKRGRISASESLVRLRSPNSNVQSELDRLEENILNTQPQPNNHAQHYEDGYDDPNDTSLIGLLKQPDVYKPLIFAFALNFFKQSSGIYAVYFYQKDIIKQAAPSMDPNVATISIAAAQTAATIFESFIVDKLGRRMLLIGSGATMSFMLGGMGLFYFVRNYSDKFAKDYAGFPLAVLIIYIVAYNMGFAPIPWMMIPEMTPVKARGIVTGSATAFSWGIAFLVTKYFAAMSISMTPWGAWWFFAALCGLGVVFLCFLLPETNGKTFDEIQNRYATGWKNSLFVALATTERKRSFAMSSSTLYSTRIRPSLLRQQSSKITPIQEQEDGYE